MTTLVCISIGLTLWNLVLTVKLRHEVRAKKFAQLGNPYRDRPVHEVMLLNQVELNVLAFTLESALTHANRDGRVAIAFSLDEVKKLSQLLSDSMKVGK